MGIAVVIMTMVMMVMVIMKKKLIFLGLVSVEWGRDSVHHPQGEMNIYKDGKERRHYHHFV